MAIIYTNDMGQQISIQEAIESKRYIKIFTEEGINKQKEFYTDGVFVTRSYVVKSQEEIDAILLDIQDTTFEYSMVLGKYEIIEFRSYTQRVITEKMISIINIEINQSICFKKKELVDGVLKAIFTEKRYYGKNGKRKYSFEYNPDGTCFQIFDEEEDDEIFAWDIGKPGISFTWQGFEYYQNAEPLLPE